MGLCCSTSPPLDKELKAAGQIANNQISGELIQAEQADVQKIKILTLGTGDVGKSTLLKQVKLTFGKGIDKHHLRQYKFLIRTSILRAVSLLLNTSELIPRRRHESNDTAISATKPRDQPSPLDNPTVDGLRQKVQRAINLSEKSEREFFSRELVTDLKHFWESDLGTQVYENRSETSCLDTLGFFMEHLWRVVDPQYEPTKEDYLRIREPTIGVHRIEIDYPIPLPANQAQNVTIAFDDIGGQRSERKKWIQIFDNATAVIWVTSLSEYDQKLHEDNSRRRFDESLQEFIRMVEKPGFEACNFIVFFNKKDIFEEKIKEKPFPIEEYPGDRMDAKEVIEWHRKLYENEFTIANKWPGRQFTTYITDATDQNIVKNVCSMVFTSVIKSRLVHSGLI